LGISFLQYKSEGTEIYAEDGSLLSFVSKTSDNGTIKSCNINRQGKSYIINGTQYKGLLIRTFSFPHIGIMNFKKKYSNLWNQLSN
jgi:hypothetical protein